jgi:hypothetical protein
MQLGKYQLVRKLASGGMAEVFLAKAAGPRGFEKTLVLKRILPHLAEDEAFVEMFLGEAQLAARLDHPNVVQIFDFGEADGSYFLAMEYIDGPTLRRLIKRSTELAQPLPPGVCARMVAAAAEGLAFAHELTDAETGAPLGLVHRDISPENVLVSRQGAVKVVDFGIAKVAGQSHRTATGVVKGKVAYMPPEQLQARPMDGRVDVYALGIVLYELLTGKRPFEAVTDVSMMQAILFEPFVPAVKRRPDLPESMQRILERALAKDREQRYPDCRAFQADLERFVVTLGEPVGAYQISRLVAQMLEGPASTPPTPVAAKARETAVLEGAGASAQEPRASAALTTPMPKRAVGAERATMEAPAMTASRGVMSSGGFDAATDPATPSAGNLAPVPRVEKAEEEPAQVMDSAHLPAVVAAKERKVRRGKLMGGAVFVSALGLMGVMALLDGKKEEVVRTGPPKPAEPVTPPVAQVPDAGTPDEEVPDAGVLVAEVPDAGVLVPEVLDAGVLVPEAPDAGVKSNRRKVVRKVPVDFRIRPYGTVYLDGKLLGQTPFAAVEVTEGTHQVRVVNTELGKDVTRAFEVKAGQDNMFKLNLLAE